MRPILALIIASATASSAAAESSAAKSAAFEACAARAHGATYPLLHCYSREMQAADAALAGAFAAALANARDPKTKAYLARSQTAWLDYRDAWCEAGVARSGSLARLKLFECRLALTASRTADLNARVSPS